MNNEKERLVELSKGTWVERDVLNIAQRVYEYDENLKLQYRDGHAEVGMSPYRLMEKCKDGIWREVFPIWQLDETVLERIWAADNQRHDILARLDRTNESARQSGVRRYEERKQQEQDWLVSYLSSPKGRWSFKDEAQGKKITLDDQPGTPVKVEKLSE